MAAAAGCGNIPVLIEGLKKLEYRGYESAVLAVMGQAAIKRSRSVGCVAELESAVTGMGRRTTSCCTS